MNLILLNLIHFKYLFNLIADRFNVIETKIFKEIAFGTFNVLQFVIID